MANNKMLIDASHPEETRVAVVRGNRIEEFDFESQAKKQLRGNIYLAKVTRVEPSLQAAFIDYGGNRHGFLAFSEIHPDYYQIPVADRLALLEEEAREVSEQNEDEDGEGRSQRRRGRKRHSASSGSSDDDARDDGEDSDDSSGRDAAVEDEEGFVESVDSDDSDDEETQDDDDAGSRSISAAVETDSISEPAPPEDGDEDGAGGDEKPAEAAAETSDAKTGDADAEATEEAKPKRRTRRKPAANKKTASEETPDEAVAAETAEAEAKAEPAEAPAAEAEEEVSASEGESEDEPAARESSTPRRQQRERSRGNKREEEKSGEEEETVESVGQEDALEEVPFRRKLRRQYKIQEVIKRRQIMLVQVVKEERGNKGAAMTTYLSLAGRYSVLMPNTARGGGISRKITNAVDRKRLKAIAQELEVPKGMGVILRTAGAMRTKAEIKRDFEYLMRMWENVRTLTLSSTAPCLVYEEGSLIKRSIRDLYDKETGEILVQGEAGYREAKDFMRMLMPSHAKNVKAYVEEQSLFARFGVEQQLDRLLTPQVTLKSGGYLVINQTEALVSIDVNSGRSTREHSIEDTALQTNLEAADEVARQLRLRDLAGLVVIDFIDMEEKRNNRAVEKRLKDALKNDRARIQVGRISHFGLMEMSRQRIRVSVMESTMDVCPHCAGLGYVRSNSSIALHVFRAIEDYLTRNPRNDIVVRCPTGIAIDILNSKRDGLSDLEARFGLAITIDADPTLPGQSFVIDKGEPATGTPRSAPQAPSDYAAIEEQDALIEDEVDEEGDEEVAADSNRGNRENGRDNREGREERGGRRKRRRRRGRPESDDGGRPAGGQAAQTGGSSEDEDEDAVSDRSVDASEDGDDSEGQRRKRRRGRRGGRRNRRDGETEGGSDEFANANGNDEEGDDESAEAGIVAEAPEGAAADPGEVTAEESVAEAASPAPESEAASEATGQQAASREPQPEETASESRRGRATRRPRNTRSEPSEPADSMDSASNGGETMEATSEAAAEAEMQEAAPAQEVAADEASAKPKRGGWWRRGGGFF